MKNGDVVEVVITAHDSASSTSFSMAHNYRVTATAGNIRTWGAAIVADYIAELEKNYSGAGNNDVLGVYPTTTSFQNAVMFNRNTPTENFTTSISKQGTVASQAYNPRAAILASLTTGVRGRSYRGRLYYPPSGETNVDAGGTLSGNAQVVFAGFFDAIRTLGNTDENGALAVYSRKLSTPDIVFSTVVSAATLRIQLASQRRRRRNLS